MTLSQLSFDDTKIFGNMNGNKYLLVVIRHVLLQHGNVTTNKQGVSGIIHQDIEYTHYCNAFMAHE